MWKSTKGEYAKHFVGKIKFGGTRLFCEISSIFDKAIVIVINSIVVGKYEILAFH